jgi:hypothetical protein
MAFEPLVNADLSIEDNPAARTRVKVVASLLANEYRACSKITLVEDNLSAHRPCTFYEVYEPLKAKAYLDRIDSCFYTHAWLLAGYG